MTTLSDRGSRRAAGARPYRVFGRRHLETLPQLEMLSPAARRAMLAVSAVLPFRVNNYVVEDLIDWSAVPDDPIFQLTFPQPAMLSTVDRTHIEDLIAVGSEDLEVRAAARAIQQRLNPHPSGQRELNVPTVGDQALPGIQHKYRETVLFFPSAGQTCHAYCTYCFRWAQFVGDDELKFASRNAHGLREYVADHPDVSSVLLTGGDPMIMKAKVLRRCVEPLLDPSLEHLRSIRIGTKAPAYWPYRFTTDPDADEVLRLFEDIVRSDRHLAVMVHYSHPRELETPVAQEALRRIRETGATVRCQAPLIRRVNDSAEVWADLWRLQVRHGAVPYYMFVERDTGPNAYFEVPLGDALGIFHDAYRQVSGLARTVRGPAMSATPGKVVVLDRGTIYGEEVFVLQFIQARKPEWVGRTFFAKYDPAATWFSDLVPAAGQAEFFFEADEWSGVPADAEAVVLNGLSAS